MARVRFFQLDAAHGKCHYFCHPLGLRAAQVGQVPASHQAASGQAISIAGIVPVECVLGRRRSRQSSSFARSIGLVR